MSYGRRSRMRKRIRCIPWSKRSELTRRLERSWVPAGRFSENTKNHRFSDHGAGATTKKKADSKRAPINYEAKELSSTTCPDFEQLFAQHNGVQGDCWRTFYHHT